MAPSESYDPRTWRDGVDYSRVAKMYPRVGSGRTGRLALLLSAAFLLGGAVLAYATRSEPPPPPASASQT